MKQKILIVDDKPENLLVLKKELDVLSNVDIIEATSGNEALTLALNNDFALVILDVQMPEMDGYELAQILHADAKTSDLPLIFLSAVYSDDFHISKSYKSGAVDFITKPFNSDILLAKVQTFLKLDMHTKNLEVLVKSRTNELNVSLENWRFTFDAIQDYVAIIDTDHNIMYVNKAMIDEFGDDLIGEKCYNIFHADHEIPENCPAKNTMKEGCFNCAEITEERDSEERVLEISTSPIMGGSNEVKQFVHIVRDITDRKNVDKKLLHGEKMQAIGQLAGGVAHDFNNQLTAILGYATLLKDKVENDEELTRFVDVIIASTKRSADLTKKLLAFARKGIFRKSDNDMHKLIKESLGLVDKSLNKNIKIDLHLNAVHSIVNCDSSQMENAFLNLIINAKDAMPDGGTLKISTDNVWITSDIETNLKPELYIEIKVKDSGSGMSKEIISHIFEPFFSTKKEKGTGLGLSAVYGTVTGHKGSIEVDSVKGEGTEFTIKLVTIQHGNEVGEETEFALGDAKDSQSNTAVVLLVDDEIDVKNYIADLVKILGYNVITCSDGKEAVDIYEKRCKEIDVVLMDMIMPGMDGAEAHEKMQKINPEIKTIFVSGYNNDQGKKILKKNPHSVWLVHKPFTPKAIAVALKTALS